MKELIQQAANLLKNTNHIAVLTGAGVSKESGVPTFRDAMEGLWAKYDPQELATPQAFQRNPKLVWDWYQFRRDLVRQAKPNPGHFALAKIEARQPQTWIITQNVDNLHEQAGSQQVIHLHGNIAQSKCFFDCQGSPTLIDDSLLDASKSPPDCPHCGKWVRPNVVWFGESLPIDALNHATYISQICDVMLVIGTSGLVYPAAGLPKFARQHGAKIIEINPIDSAITPIAHLKLTGASGEVLPQILELWT
ncbi:MAG: NAD-dependent protein deacylase [Phototrophicales bacterium]|nr:MAG: NAD-dependent protein deacylase [Phototrophicales bacterium]RMG72175.1 MAG: NAD-dependent deacylase [Chloroflexota bacterium]